jgi:succinate dehydrogenase / fumarate reductase flavoprotein subunit
VSANIIDQAVAQGVPCAREYGGTLANRTFGGVQVSRTFYAAGQTGQQLLLGAYSSLNRMIDGGKVTMHCRKEMLDLIVVDGVARGIVTRDLATGAVERFTADAVVLATGGYSNVFYLSTNAMHCNVTAAWRAHRRGAFMANPCYTQIHPTCIPQHGEFQSKLTLMSESLRNDGRVWVPAAGADRRKAAEIPASATWFLATWRPETPSTCVTKAVGLAERGAPSIWTSGMRSSVTARTPSASGTATSSRCMRRSPVKTRTRLP